MEALSASESQRDHVGFHSPFGVSTGKASGIVQKGGSASLALNSPHLLNVRSCMVLAIGSGTFRRRERHAHEVA